MCWCTLQRERERDRAALLAHVSSPLAMWPPQLPGTWGCELSRHDSQDPNSVNICESMLEIDVLSFLFPSGFFLITQRTGGIFVQSALTAGGLTMASATGCCPKQKQEAGRSLPRPAPPRGPTSPASTRCLKWKCCSKSWRTVRRIMQQPPHF